MTEKRIIVFLMALAGISFLLHADEVFLPDHSARKMSKVAPTTRPWHEPDDSLQRLNKEITSGHSSQGMIPIMEDGLVGKYQMILWDRESCKVAVPRILEALYRSGDDARITNIIHKAFLSPTNHYREATLYAYVMASPVPMTVLAETVVKHFSAEQRFKWYVDAYRRSFDPFSKEAKFIVYPSREAFRFAHFLFMAKQIETDPECLRAIGNPTDPKRE